MTARSLAVLASAFVVSFAAGCSAGSSHDGERFGASRAAMANGQPSMTSEDDFVVFLGKTDRTNKSRCAASLIAPNLVVTARHCVVKWDDTKTFTCEASGEPGAGSGGSVTGYFEPSEIAFYPGYYGEGDWLTDDSNTKASAHGAKIIDDGKPTLCSHDLAFVVLDQAIAKPTAPLDLDRRLAENDRLSFAGWGLTEQLAYQPIRRRIDNVSVLRVGPPDVGPATTGGLSPRTFDTTSATCRGDSGGPAFVAATYGVVGVAVRSTLGQFECNDNPGTESTFMTLGDFPTLLHQAFDAAGKQPKIVGHSNPGWLGFGEKCELAAACASMICENRDGVKACNMDCAQSACPSGFVCDAGKRCAVAPKSGAPPATSPPPASPAPDPSATDEPPTSSAVTGDCGVGLLGARHGGTSLAAVLVALLVAWRRRRAQ